VLKKLCIFSLTSFFFHLVEHEIFYEFLLSVWTKLRKGTTDFVMPVRLQHWTTGLGHHWKVLKKFNTWIPSKNLRDNCCNEMEYSCTTSPRQLTYLTKVGTKECGVNFRNFLSQFFNYNEWRCAILPRHQLYLI